MFRTFVVPLDGSALAERALPYAIRLAQARHGRLLLTRAALAPVPRTLSGSEWEADQSQAVQEAEQYLRKIADTLSDHVTTDTIVTYGRPAAEILEIATRYGADGIIMATHGRTGLPHLLYGSVTEAVLAECPLPVLVVHARPGEPAAPFSPDSARVLVPQDGSVNDAAAVQAAVPILGPGGELILVSVIAPPEHVAYDDFGHVRAYLDQLEEADRVRARQYLNGIAVDLRQRIPGIQVKLDVRLGEPAPEIANAAVDHAADLIVMATHGRTGINRALLGSVAGTVLRTGPAPVLLIHPHATAAAIGPVEEPEHTPFVTF